MPRTLATAVLLSIAALPLTADTICSTLTGFHHSMSIQYTTNGSTFTTGSVGLLQGTRNPGAYTDAAAGTQHGDGAVSPGGTYFAFCVELTEGISLNTSYLHTWSQVTVAPTSAGANGMSDQRANLLGELLYRNAPRLNQNLGRTTTGAADLAARALQIAIWEIVHEGTTTGNIALGSLNVTSGNTRFQRASNVSVSTHNAVIAQANTWLGQLTGTMTGAQNRYRTLTLGTTQDLITPTPEPGTFVLLGASLAGLWIAKKRKSKGLLSPRAERVD